ncbi:MAG TPA: 5-oxoprolinase subunit PxpB [Bacillales bacterium]|nr:5-oxoprolinase subunit PxpB [Bacillales bacterium]
MNFRYKPAGDRSILVELGDTINEKINARVRGLADLVESDGESGFGEVILGYKTLLVDYDPIQLSFQEAVSEMKHWEDRIIDQDAPKGRLVEIPTVYGGEMGPDLNDVAEHNGLTPEEVVKIHSGTRYLVYFLGFTPGFPFLGGMSEKIATPRLSSPRVSIPGGSVGIAESQTGIYPVSSPGGWRLIGRTPVQLYDHERENPFLLEPGDHVQFTQMEADEFEQIKAQVEKGEYHPVRTRKGGDEDF